MIYFTAQVPIRLNIKLINFTHFFFLGSSPERVDDLWYHTGKISVCFLFLLFSVSPDPMAGPPDALASPPYPPAGLLTLHLAS